MFLTSSDKSTNVRNTTERKGVGSARVGMRALSAVSPKAASYVARRLFVTPRKYARPQREHAILAKGKRFEFLWMRRTLCAWSFGEGPTIALVHGWEGRGAQLGSLVDPLVNAGYRVVMFDAPAHGDSPGKTADPLRFAGALQALAKWVDGFYGVIAHSMGSLAVSIALREGLSVQRVAFVAPGASPQKATAYMAELLDLPPSVLGGLRSQLAKKAGKSWEALNRSALAEGFELPLLVVHDEDDREVKVENAQRIVHRWPGSKLVVTKGLGHTRILRDEGVVKKIVSFMGPAPKNEYPDRWRDFLHWGADVDML